MLLVANNFVVFYHAFVVIRYALHLKSVCHLVNTTNQDRKMNIILFLYIFMNFKYFISHSIYPIASLALALRTTTLSASQTS